MSQKYKVRFFQGNTYEVIEIVTTYGERTFAYDSEPDTVEENKVFQGGLADCEAYIRLQEGGYMYGF
jgi:hypothetical protein